MSSTNDYKKSSTEEKHKQRILEESEEKQKPSSYEKHPRYRNKFITPESGFYQSENASILAFKETTMRYEKTTITTAAPTKKEAIEAIIKNVDKIFTGFLDREICCRNGYDIIQSLYNEKTSITSISFRGCGIYGCSKHYNRVADRVNAYKLKVKNINNEYYVSLIRNDNFTIEY